MKWFVIVIAFFLFTVVCFSQVAMTPSQQTAVPQIYVPIDSLNPDAENLQLAISSLNYPVTPGDVYILSFIMAGNPISNTLLVESDYTINLDVLGKIDAKNMTFPELKPVVELIISDAYPRSMPSLTIQTIGSFEVILTGAVPQTLYLQAWGLSRLSSILNEHLTELSSIRDIRIRALDNSENVYDVLKTFSLGALDQDPFLKPGDTIIISPVGSFVEIKGEVVRPGKYQILSGETTADVLAFAGGPTTIANKDRIRIEHIGAEIPSTKFITLEEVQSGVELNNGDVISIWKRQNKKTMVFIEGGVTVSRDNAVPDVMDTSLSAGNQSGLNRIIHFLSSGDTVFDVISGYEEQLSEYADLSHAYIIREGQDKIIPVDLHQMMYSGDLSGNVILEPNDRIAIPVREPYVNVIGAVNIPGRIEYTPPERADYYIFRAGGIDDIKNSHRKYKIIGPGGEYRSLNDPIQAGDTIKVLSNNFWYNLGLYFEPITTAALFVTSAITLVNVLNNN